MAGISFQTFKPHKVEWDASALMLAELDKLVERQLHWLIIGVSALGRIVQLRTLVRSFSLVSAHPVQTAVRGQRLVNGRPFPDGSLDKLRLTRLNFEDVRQLARGELVLGFDEPAEGGPLLDPMLGDATASSRGDSTQLELSVAR